MPNDLYIAHLSIYHFAATQLQGGRVLDVGCGAGYGADYLRIAGATAVVGLDLDPRNIRYARRRFPSNRYEVADAERIPDGLGSFNLAVASNVLEHLQNVESALTALRKLLTPDGRLLVAVPPIVDEASMRANEAIPYHRSNYHVTTWTTLLAERFADVRAIRHHWKEGIEPDFGDPFRSYLSASDFLFTEVAPADLQALPTLTALFVARHPR